MTSISLTIPNEYNALTHAASMLRNMANDLRPVDDEEQGFLDAQHTDLPPIETLQEVYEPSVPLAPSQNITIIPVGVEIDAEPDPLPYDVRIHTKGNVKKLKKTGKWKYARNIDPKTIKTVEAELRATMNASPDNPITPVPPAPITEQPKTPPASVTLPSEDMYLVDGKEYTAEQLHASGWNDEQMKQYKVTAMTFPEFMAKYTPAIAATTINESMVTSALNRQGLSSLPMLAARPDLIPAIYKELFGE